MATRVRYNYTDGRKRPDYDVEVSVQTLHERLEEDWPIRVADDESRERYEAWCEAEGVDPAFNPEPEDEVEDENADADESEGEAEDGEADAEPEADESEPEDEPEADAEGDESDGEDEDRGPSDEDVKTLLEGNCEAVESKVAQTDDVALLEAALEAADRDCALEALTERHNELTE